MAVVSDIEIRLRADIARLQQDMTAVRRTVDQGMQGVTRAANLAKAALGGVFAGLSIAAFAKEVIQAQREFDKLNASLVTATGSTENAASAFSALQKFASQTPYSLAEATEAFIKLRNLGLNPSEKALNSYGNTAAAMGKGLNQLIEAVADASTGEFERLKEFGITAKQNGDRVALTFQGLTKTIGNNAKDIQKYLMDIGDVNFAGAMEKRANTLDGAISNLGDTWDAFLRKIAQNGAGQAAAATVVALGNALNDLGAIFDAVSGAADREAGKVKEASAVHMVLTTAFEAVAVLGVNVAYILDQLGKDMGAFAASFAAFAQGELKMSAKIIEIRKKDAEEARIAVDAKSAAILGASKKQQEAQEAEAAAAKKSTADTLGGYEIVLTAQQKRDKADQDTLDLRNRLNGVNAQTAGDLTKLKVALEAGAISQAQYNKFTSQITKETTLASTVYKEGAKAIDMSTEAIKRRSQAQEYANKRDLEQLDFLRRTGQMSEDDYIAKSASKDIDALNAQKKALQEQSDILKGRYDTEKERAALKTQMDAKDQDIEARRTKQDHDQFELEQKRYREAVGNTADLIEAAQNESKAQKDRTRDQQDEIDMLGLTEKQIAYVTAARLRDQAVALDRKAEVGQIEEVNETLRTQAEELRKQADLGITKQRVQEQQKMWSDIEQTAHDTFVSIADGGKGAFQRLKESAKNIFFEWLYQMSLKKWIINVGTSFTGGLGMSAVAGAASSAAGSAASTVGAVGLGGWLAAGGIGGSLAAGAGWLTGATSLGGALGAGTALAGTGTIAGGIAGAGVLVGAIAPLAIGAVLASAAWNKAFGMGSKQYSDNSTLTGSISNGAFSGSVNTAYTQKGGWFRSDKSGVDKAAVDAMTASGLSAAYEAIKAASKDYANVLGLNADSIQNRTQAISVTLGKDEAANQKAIADFFTGVSDTIAAELLPSIGMFQQQGETASVTFQRLAVDFKGINDLMAKVGIDVSQAFKVTGVAAIEARERVISLAGGLDALGSQLDFYYSTYLNTLEKIAPLRKQIDEQLDALGASWIKNASDYKFAVDFLVSSGDIATESGAKLYAGLLKLAPQMKALDDAIQEINQKNVDSAMAALSRAVDAQKDIVAKAYNDSMTVLDARIEGLNGTIAKTSELSEALKGAMQGIDTPQAGEFSRRAAQAQITAFLAIARAGGALPPASDLRDAVSALGNDATGQFSTLAEYQRDVARTNNELEQLGGLTDGQLSLAQQQLDVLNAQKEMASAAYDAEIMRLDSLNTAAQQQLDYIKGIDTSIKSVDKALSIVNSALSTYAIGLGDISGGAKPTNTGGGSFFSGLLSSVYNGGVPADNSTLASGTMSGSSASMQPVFESMERRLATMEENSASMTRAMEQLASEFHSVSMGGNSLLTEPA